MPNKTKRKIFEEALENEARDGEIARLYMLGYTQAAIGEQVGLARQSVNVALKKIQERWKEATIRDFDAARERELQTLDFIQAEAMRSWEASKSVVDKDGRPLDKSRGEYSRSVSSGEGGDGQPRNYVTSTVRLSHGNPRYLDSALNCVEKRMKILGLVVEQHDHNIHGTIATIEVSADTMADVFREMADYENAMTTEAASDEYDHNAPALP